MQKIITHVAPDWDAITSVWLLKRFGGLDSADVLFLNTGAPDEAVLNAATAIVDTGRILDPMRLRFDHHQLPGTEANACCATSLVFQWLKQDSADLEYLAPLIDLIYAGDTGKPAANESRRIGIHALLSATRAQYRPDDHRILGFGFDVLDRLAAHLKAAQEARATLDTHTVYTSTDGLIVALRDAPQGATFAAYEQGARLVVFANYEKNAIGVMRGGEGAEVHVGGLVSSLLNDYDCGLDDITPAMFDELCIWFRHNAGFFAGRGTDKAPSDKPILVDLRDVAVAIDRAWATRRGACGGG